MSKVCYQGNSTLSVQVMVMAEKVEWLSSYYLLTDVGYGVHPAPNANLIAYIWRTAKLMH